MKYITLTIAVAGYTFMAFEFGTMTVTPYGLVALAIAIASTIGYKLVTKERAEQPKPERQIEGWHEAYGIAFIGGINNDKD